MLTSADILAKLLATENITVLRAKSSTASFDIKQRILTLPLWDFSDSCVEEMLVLHEVGHALFTTMNGYMSVLEREKHLQHYMNVIEDVRIEKKMKERYPGSNKTFYQGYKQLNEKDFFEIKDKNKQFFDELYLIDKINLYYKVGADCGFTLSDAEKQIISIVDKCVTEADVEKAARMVYEMDLNKKKSNENKHFFVQDPNGNITASGQKDSSENNEIIEIEENDFDDLDNTGEETPVRGNGSKKTDQELKSITQEAFNKHLKFIENRDSSQIFYHIPKFINTNDNIFVGYKTILEQIDKEKPFHQINPEKISSTTTKIVSNLIKEFEMKKSAQSLKYSTVSKTGQLSAAKMFSYKVKDDIFKKITRVKDSKRHGMIFLLDWSGSMSSHISSTLDQILNLSLFCKKGGIPFQVLAFSDNYESRSLYSKAVNQNGLGNANSFNLLEFFSDKMTIPEIERMYAYMQNYRRLSKKFHMGGTPLNEALIYMIDYLKEFIQKNSVEKMSFITFTDGEASQIFGYSSSSIRKSFLNDPVTRRQYKINHHGAITEILMNVIKTRYPMIDTAGFYITQMNSYLGGIYSFCVQHYQAPREVIVDKTDKIKKSMKQNGYAIEKNLAGRDVYYILNSKNLNITDVELEDLEEGVTSSKIAREFSKSVESGKNSRIILNKFIEQIA